MVLENLVSRASTQVIRERKLEAIDTPRVEKLDYEPGKPLLFHLRVEKDPAVKAKDYKGIKVNRPSTEVTERRRRQNAGRNPRAQRHPGRLRGRRKLKKHILR